MTLVLTNESKETIKKYEDFWNKIGDFIRSITKNSDNYDEKYLKIKFNSDDKLLLNNTVEIYNVTIVIRVISYENDKYHLQVFLKKLLYKL